MTIRLKFMDIRLLFNFSFDFRAPPVAQKSFLPVSSLKTNDCATQRAFSIWIFNFPKIFCKGKESDLKSCLRNVKCALQAVRWSRRSRLSRGFDFSAPRRLFRVLRELDRRTFDISAETPGGQNLPQSLYERVCWLALVWIHQSLRKKQKCFFFFKICLLALFSFDSSVELNSFFFFQRT